MAKLLLFSFLVIVFLYGGLAKPDRLISELEEKPVRLSKEELFQILNNDDSAQGDLHKISPSSSSEEKSSNPTSKRPKPNKNSSEEDDDDWDDAVDAIFWTAGICIAVAVVISIITWFCCGCCCCCFKNKNGSMRDRQRQRTTVTTTKTTAISQVPNVHGSNRIENERLSPVYYNKEVEASERIVDNFVSLKLDDLPPPTYEELHPAFNPEYNHHGKY